MTKAGLAEVLSSSPWSCAGHTSNVAACLRAASVLHVSPVPSHLLVAGVLGAPKLSSLLGAPRKRWHPLLLCYTCLQVCWAHPKFGSLLATASFDGKVIVWKEVADNVWQQVCSL